MWKKVWQHAKDVCLGHNHACKECGKKVHRDLYNVLSNKCVVCEEIKPLEAYLNELLARQRIIALAHELPVRFGHP